MKIAIIGSGFFGSTIALHLAKNHDVDIFEKEKKILNGASSANQFRFHLGYHYPRSTKTVKEISKSKTKFIKYNGNKIFGNTKNYYLVAKKSKVNFKKYQKFLKENYLYYKIIKNIPLNDNIEKIILTNEKILNFFKYKDLIKRKFLNSNVNIKYSRQFSKNDLPAYDKVIIATYSNNNLILKKLGIKNIPDFEYQLVEKIVVKLPRQYSNKSYVVIDGDFVCIDPFLGTKYHLLSDVKLSKLEIVRGKYPKFLNINKKFINKGIIKDLKVSRFERFIFRSSKYLPFLKKAKYVGSIFVVRTIKKNKKRTDERTSTIKRHSNKITSILSGKWNNCVYLAKHLEKNL